MARQQPVALVFAGPVSRGNLGRLPGLHQRLTWIKSSSVATASRAVHALHCGSAVSHYSDLKNAAAILISAPPAALAGIVAELAASGLSWKDRIVVLFDSEEDSAALQPLSRLGAEAASVLWHPRPEQFLVEGTNEAIRFVRTLTGKRNLIQLRSREAYQCAMRLVADEFFVLLTEAMEKFEAAGMSRLQAEKTTAATLAESARTWLRAGKRLLKKRAATRPA